MNELIGTADWAVMMPQHTLFISGAIQREIGNRLALQWVFGFFILNHIDMISQKVCFFHILLYYFHGVSERNMI